jgi:hypothetical protein
MCKEPVWNFICSDCLSDSLKKWLPDQYMYQYAIFHDTLANHFKFKTLEENKCLSCSSYDGFTICPYCYTNEVFQWLKGFNKRLAEDFVNMFRFDFEGSGFKNSLTRSDAEPITEEENPKEEFGICDDCGEYSEELVYFDGEWVCKNCASYQEV